MCLRRITNKDHLIYVYLFTLLKYNVFVMRLYGSLITLFISRILLDEVMVLRGIKFIVKFLIEICYFRSKKY